MENKKGNNKASERDRVDCELVQTLWAISVVTKLLAKKITRLNLAEKGGEKNATN